MHRTLAGCFLFVLSVTAAWQWFYCRVVAEGNPTALFFSGRRAQPPELDPSTYIYPNSLGYDGQLYRIVAHDPLFRKSYAHYLDDARYRYRRILVPGLAALLGGAHVDLAYIVVMDLLLALGALAFVLLCEPALPAWLAAVAYCCLPAVVASADRMVVDGVLIAGACAAWLFFRRGHIAALAAVLALLPLARETGALLWCGALAAYLLRREFRAAGIVAAAAIPWTAWFLYVAANTPASAAAQQLLRPPLLSFIARLFTLQHRPVSAAVNAGLQVLDAAAILCLLAALVSFAWKAWHDRDEALFFGPAVLLAACSGGPTVVGEPYDLMRVTNLAMLWAGVYLLPRHRVAGLAMLVIPALPLLIYRLPVLARL